MTTTFETQQPLFFDHPVFNTVENLFNRTAEVQGATALTGPVQVIGGTVTALFGTIAKNFCDWSVQKGVITPRTATVLDAESERWIQTGAQNIVWGIIRLVPVWGNNQRTQHLERDLPSFTNAQRAKEQVLNRFEEITNTIQLREQELQNLKRQRDDQKIAIEEEKKKKTLELSEENDKLLRRLRDLDGQIVGVAKELSLQQNDN